MLSDNCYAVVMAGGAGTRLWPLSSRDKPKHFLKLFGGKSLIELTVDKLRGHIPAHRVLILTSIVLALFILLHKSRGGGMSDLFGGGMSTGMGGTSVAERNLDRLTIMVGLVWLASIIGLLVLYRYFPEVGALG